MADITMSFTYSKGVTKGLKNRLKQEIVKSFEESPELKKEIRQVFQKANRRIQNVERAGVLSPAVAQLDLDNTSGFSKFKMGSDWESTKRNYAKAIAFLNQPTSTATGARQFQKQLQESVGLTGEKAELFEPLQEKLTKKYASLSGSLLNALPYYSMMQDIYETATYTTFNMVESEAQADAQRLQNAIDSVAESGAETVTNIIEDWEDAFKMNF